MAIKAFSDEIKRMSFNCVSDKKKCCICANHLTLLCTTDQLRPFLDDSAGGFVERLFEALEESRSARGNRGAGEKNRKRDLKVIPAQTLSQ